MTRLTIPALLDIASVGKKVVDFYKQRGEKVTSPLDKALVL
jgi:hypothetical protein